ncbi:glycosyltransferase family 2 protein [Ligilactobacillus saerimneri]|uniref:glycosyltransferase family 2 protein n=1 Tax=Ligilactobacillus saerimneri TaxID=228229 RepID=UPI0024B1CE11|nr:glycosyltransferase family 2 protein [Ligilactobacillus saerimneri]MDI9206698.1 glycosyltransferase family 2 protein [Ligilactobacillus saerimneri]
MKEATVDVIVTVHNREKYLAACLNALASQTYPQINLIIVDDGSQDHSLELINEFKHQTELPVQVLHNDEGHGISYARNQGLDAASHDYVTFVDDDDVVTPEHIQILVAGMDDQGGLSATSYRRTKDIPATLAEIDNTQVYQAQVTTAKIGEYILGFNKFQGSVCNKMFARSVLEEHQLRFNEHLFMCEDLEFVCRYLMQCGATSHTVSENITYVYRLNEDSMVERRLTAEDVLRKGQNEQDAYQLITTEMQAAPALAAKVAQKKVVVTTNLIKALYSTGANQKAATFYRALRPLLRKQYWRVVFGGFVPVKDTVHFIIDTAQNYFNYKGKKK